MTPRRPPKAAHVTPRRLPDPCGIDQMWMVSSYECIAKLDSKKVRPGDLQRSCDGRPDEFATKPTTLGQKKTKGVELHLNNVLLLISARTGTRTNTEMGNSLKLLWLVGFG